MDTKLALVMPTSTWQHAGCHDAKAMLRQVVHAWRGVVEGGEETYLVGGRALVELAVPVRQGSLPLACRIRCPTPLKPCCSLESQARLSLVNGHVRGALVLHHPALTSWPREGVPRWQRRPRQGTPLLDDTPPYTLPSRLGPDFAHGYGAASRGKPRLCAFPCRHGQGSFPMGHVHFLADPSRMADAHRDPVDTSTSACWSGRGLTSGGLGREYGGVSPHHQAVAHRSHRGFFGEISTGCGCTEGYL